MTTPKMNFEGLDGTMLIFTTNPDSADFLKAALRLFAHYSKTQCSHPSPTSSPAPTAEPLSGERAGQRQPLSSLPLGSLPSEPVGDKTTIPTASWMEIPAHLKPSESDLKQYRVFETLILEPAAKSHLRVGVAIQPARRFLPASFDPLASSKRPSKFASPQPSQPQPKIQPEEKP